MKFWSHNTHKSALPKHADGWKKHPFSLIEVGDPQASYAHTKAQLQKMGMVGVYTAIKPHRPEYRHVVVV